MYIKACQGQFSHQNNLPRKYGDPHKLVIIWIGH